MLASPAPTSTIEPSHWDPLMIAVVGIICCIFIFFSYHRILKYLCSVFCSINIFRNRGQSRRIHEAVPDDPSLQFQSRGLDSFILHSLPITKFNNTNAEELCRGNTDCAICLGEFEEGEWQKHLPRCSHVFHVSCIDTWFQTHSSCPLCRSYVFDLTTDQENSISTYSIQLETLRREEIHQERREYYQSLRSHVLMQNSPLQTETRVPIVDV